MVRSFVVSLAVIFVVALAFFYSENEKPVQGQPAVQKNSPVAQATASKEFGNVLANGAIGDGVADDTAAIQKMVESKLGTIRFTRGIFKLTKTVVIDLDKVGFTSLTGDGTARIIMAGEGPAFHFIGTHRGRAEPKDFKDNVWQNQRAPMVDGLEIVGEHPKACGIELSGTMQMMMTRLVVRKALHGIHITKFNRNVTVSDCHLYNNRGVGLYFDGVNLHQANITGCHISYNDAGGIVCEKCELRNIQITGCDIESNQGLKNTPTANVLIDCTKSTHGVDEVAITGCTIQHNHNAAGSANIRILGNSPPETGLPTIREGNITITGNIISDVRVNIHLQECRGIVLTGNTFWEGYEHNLLIEKCSHLVIGPNNFDRNPRYDFGKTPDVRNSLVFRDCDACTLTGLHVANVWNEAAAVLVENCNRFNITNCAILDCDNIGLHLQNTSNSRVSDCMIRDDRPTGKKGKSLVVTGGKGNMITDNMLLNGPADEKSPGQ